MSFEKLTGSSFVTIAMFAALSSPAWAQDTLPRDAAPQADQARPEESSGDIVVTALRRETRLRDVPLSITAVNAERLELSGVTNLRDLGNLAPGLVFNGQNGLASPTIRGVQSTLGVAGAESPTAIYVDGVYQPNTAANFQDLADVEHVEVLKGPQGTLFGRNATGGAIVIRTIDPGFTPTGSFTVSDGIYTGGSARTSHDVTVKGYVSGPIAGDVLAGSLSGFYEWIDGYLTNDLNGKRTGRIEKYNIRGKLLYEPSDSFKIMIAGFYSHKNDESAFASQPLNGNTNVQFYPDGVVPTKIWHVASPLRNGVGQNYVTTKSVYGKLDWNIGDQIGSITAMSSFLKVDAQLIVPIAAAHSPTCVASFNCIIYDEKYPGKTFQHEISFNSGDWGPVQLVAGAMYFDDSNTIFSNTNPPLDANGDVAGRGPVYLVGTVRRRPGRASAK